MGFPIPPLLDTVLVSVLADPPRAPLHDSVLFSRKRELVPVLYFYNTVVAFL